MKIKTIASLLAISASLSVPVCGADGVDANIKAETAVHSETTAYNWYCKHTKDHSQPTLDFLLSFTKDNDAYYIDKKHTDYGDEEKVIYLTFDAGYENGNIEKILDTLKKEEVPGAFFVLENLVKSNSELVKRMSDEGHLICNHTASHKDMSNVTDKDEFLSELETLEAACSEIGVECAKYYRPPEGRFTEQNLKFASAAGYKTVFWSFAYVDWDNKAQMSESAAIKKVLDGTHNGEVILLHPTSATNAAILDDLIKAWRDEGFRFGTLDELCK